MKLGTIGTSWITETFIEATKQGHRLTLTSVYSRSESKAKDFAFRHSAEHYFTNLEEMAQSKEIDIMYIASPNSLHFEHAMLFLQHKKHVICEKPLFSNTQEWDKATQIAKENNVFLFEAIRNIHAPNFSHLKDNIYKIGNVRSANLHYLQYSSKYDAFLNGEEPNVFSIDFSGGALVDLGIYPIYLAVALFGQPTSISYHPIILRSGVDGNGTLILNYNSFICTILCSKISHSYMGSEIHGEEGTILFDSVAPIKGLQFISRKNTSIFGTTHVDNDLIYEIEKFVSTIETNNIPEYERLQDLSRTVLEITETARKQNGITFACEK